MHSRKTRVEHDGTFWRIRVKVGDEWVRVRTLYSTRAKARQDRPYWANY